MRFKLKWWFSNWCLCILEDMSHRQQHQVIVIKHLWVFVFIFGIVFFVCEWKGNSKAKPNQTKPKHCICIIKPIRRIAWDLGLFMMGFSDLIYWFICLLHCRRVPRNRPLQRKHRSSQWLLSGRPHRIFCRVWNWNSCLLFNKLIFHSAILFSVTFFSCFCFYFRGLNKRIGTVSCCRFHSN